MLKVWLSRKLPFQIIERQYETAVGILFVRMKPFTPLDAKVDTGKADDTSFGKLQNVPYRKVKVNNCSERTFRMRSCNKL
jgi:hypothetical protein